MAMKTSNTNIELSNDIKISDSVVKAVVEKNSILCTIG